MKYITWWSVLPGAEDEAAHRFIESGNSPGEGVTRLGQWFSLDARSGYTLSETEDPAAIYKFALQWNDVLEIEITPVIDVEQAGPAIQEWHQEQHEE